MSSDEIKKTYGIFSNPLNNKLISDLRQKGEDVLVFPPVKTEKLEITETVAEIIKNLTDFDWIIFTDIFTADYFVENLREQEKDFFELDNLTVCALGEAVADRLRFVQVHADVIPPKINDEAVFAAISQFTGGDFRDLHFLVLKEKTMVFTVEENLKNENASVETLPLYETKFESGTETLRLKTLLRGGAIDEFIFAAAEDVLNLKFLFQENDLTVILNEIKTSATTENAFLALQENGLRPLYFQHK